MQATTGGGGQTSAAIVATTSNYSNRSTSGAHASVTAPGSGSNQTLTPTFADAAAGDYHEAPASPTIDAGNTALANGTRDVDGDLRTVDAGTDIGADERIPAPAVVTGTAAGRKTHSAIVAGTILSAAAVTTYHFDYGTSAAYGKSTPSGTVGPAVTAQKVRATLTGLRAGRPYHFRLVASSAAGADAGGDGTFATRFQGVAILHKKASVLNKRASIRVRCPGDTAGPTPGSKGSCDGTLQLRRPRGAMKPVGSEPFSIAAGQTVVVKVLLKKGAREQIDKDGFLRVRAVAKAHNGLGVGRTRKKKLMLLPPSG
jgi:hypothetical protein